MTPSEIARTLGVDITEEDPKVLEALSTLSIHLDRRRMTHFGGPPEIGMLLRITCHESSHPFYHGREIIVTNVTAESFFGFLTDTKKIVDGTLKGVGVKSFLLFIGKAPKEVWEVKYPELKDKWGKDK